LTNFIINSIANEDKSRIRNLYLDKKMEKYLNFLCKKIYLWTAAVPKIFGSPKIECSSAIVESFFSKLKNQILRKTILPTDAFLEKFQEFVSGEKGKFLL
jgi:hypothetical protein